MWESAYCIGWIDGGRERSSSCMGKLLLDIDPPLLLPLFPLNNSTQYIVFNKWITIYLVCHLELGS